MTGDSSSNSMFRVGDYVFNQRTGHIGPVIGYGHQILNDVCTATIKVLVKPANYSGQRELVEEDLSSAWVRWPFD